MINYLQTINGWRIEKTITENEIHFKAVRIPEPDFAQQLIDSITEKEVN